MSAFRVTAFGQPGEEVLTIKPPHGGFGAHRLKLICASPQVAGDTVHLCLR